MTRPLRQRRRFAIVWYGAVPCGMQRGSVRSSTIDPDRELLRVLSEITARYAFASRAIAASAPSALVVEPSRVWSSAQSVAGWQWPSPGADVAESWASGRRRPADRRPCTAGLESGRQAALRPRHSAWCSRRPLASHPHAAAAAWPPPWTPGKWLSLSALAGARTGPHRRQDLSDV